MTHGTDEDLRRHQLDDEVEAAFVLTFGRALEAAAQAAAPAVPRLNALVDMMKTGAANEELPDHVREMLNHSGAAFEILLGGLQMLATVAVVAAVTTPVVAEAIAPASETRH